MAPRWCFALLLVLCAAAGAGASKGKWDPVIRMPGERGAEGPVEQEEEDGAGTRWAVLVAGSSGYGNYRHQADVCHAYQILIKGGVKEENIVVFMYDDIANNALNPRPGVIINHPKGEDVYAGVPKSFKGGKHYDEDIPTDLGRPSKQDACGRRGRLAPGLLGVTRKLQGPAQARGAARRRLLQYCYSKLIFLQ